MSLVAGLREQLCSLLELAYQFGTGEVRAALLTPSSTAGRAAKGHVDDGAH